MSDYVTDTHALYWYLRAAPQLSAKARAVFFAGEQGQARIYISSIVLAELYYLNVKYGRPLDFAQEYHRLASAGQFCLLIFARLMFYASMPW